MQQEILSKLEASRKELLDLGMRNTLLNYKIPLARGLHIVQEKSENTYDILVRKGKAMTFVGRPGKDNDDTLFDLPELSEPELQDAYNDTKLQTNETEQKLQTRILNTYYFSKTSIEEQGINILYLALGMLEWYEKGNTENSRHAPLILVPVYLERSSASERFRLRYSGAEIGSNLSLQAKMLTEFNITIPDLEDQEEIDIESYFNDIRERISHQELWAVKGDAIELGFFSFGKFMIYHDLDSEGWPEDKKPYDHEVIKALFTDGFNQPQPSIAEGAYLDKEPEAVQLQTVVDADSSQIIAMLGVKEGRHMVIQGPPGTGKSQTIANLIADALGAGKKILFVAEKMAALEVVKRRLDNIHLGMACLELHSHKANKRTLHEELKKVLELGKPTLQHLENEIQMLEPLIAELNDYCTAINSEIQNSSYSAHDVIGNLLRIQNEYGEYKFPKVSPGNFLSWTPAQMKEAETFAEQIQARLKAIGEPEKLLFYGTALTLLLPAEEQVLKELLTDLIETYDRFNLLKDDASRFLAVKNPANNNSLTSFVELLQLAEKSPALAGYNLDDEGWVNNRNDILEAIDAGKRLNDLHSDYENILIPEAWNQDVLSIRQNLISHGSKWYNFVIGDYKKSARHLAGLLASPMPKELEKKLQYVNAIMEAKRLSQSLESSEPLLSRLFGSSC